MAYHEYLPERPAASFALRHTARATTAELEPAPQSRKAHLRWQSADLFAEGNASPAPRAPPQKTSSEIRLQKKFIFRTCSARNLKQPPSLDEICRELFLKIKFRADSIAGRGMSLTQLHLGRRAVGRACPARQQARRSSRPNLAHDFRQIAAPRTILSSAIRQFPSRTIPAHASAAAALAHRAMPARHRDKFPSSAASARNSGAGRRLKSLLTASASW